MSSMVEWRLALIDDPEVKQRIKDTHAPIHELKVILRKAAPKASEAMLHRCAFNLVCHRKHIISEWDRQRNGKLDQQLAASKGLKSFDRSLRVLRSGIEGPIGEALDESASLSKADALAMIENLETAALSIRRNSAETKIKSEGAARSTNLARELLDEFLIVATMTWCQGTGRLPTLSKSLVSGEPSGDCSKFYYLAATPLIKRLNASGGVIEGNWGALYKRLDRRLPKVLPGVVCRLPGLYPAQRRAGKRKMRETNAKRRAEKRKPKQTITRK